MSACDGSSSPKGVGHRAHRQGFIWGVEHFPPPLPDFLSPLEFISWCAWIVVPQNRNEALYRVVTYASPVKAFATGHQAVNQEIKVTSEWQKSMLLMW